MFKEFEAIAEEQRTQEHLIPEGTNPKLIFSVFENQFRRGLINIRPGNLRIIEEVQSAIKRMVSENNPEDIICSFLSDARGYVTAVFKNFEDAAWFDDGLNY